MLLKPEVITKEAKDVFGEDAKVDLKFGANVDGYYIEVHKKVGNEILMVSACVPAIEELQDDPLTVLRQYLAYMYYYFMQALEETDDNVRNPQRKIGRKDKGSSGGGPTYH